VNKRPPESSLQPAALPCCCVVQIRQQVAESSLNKPGPRPPASVSETWFPRVKPIDRYCTLHAARCVLLVLVACTCCLYHPLRDEPRPRPCLGSTSNHLMTTHLGSLFSSRTPLPGFHLALKAPVWTERQDSFNLFFASTPPLLCFFLVLFVSRQLTFPFANPANLLPFVAAALQNVFLPLLRLGLCMCYHC
jgi:hypothetical protein